MIEENKDYPRIFSNKVPDTWICPVETTPSDLELRIRKEVMDDVNKMIEYEADTEEYHKSILLRIKDRLKLLWGSNE